MSGECQKSVFHVRDDKILTEAWVYGRDSTQAAQEGFPHAMEVGDSSRNISFVILSRRSKWPGRRATEP